MLQGIPFWLIWLALIGYAFFGAPPDRPETAELLQNLIAGNWQDINPTIVALFNIMGIWPCIYGCVLFSDGRGQKVPAWPFITLSLFVGAFALLPYLALRQENPTFIGPKSWWIRVTDSRITGLVFTTITIGFLVYGLRFGNWQDFVTQWQTSRFIHVMSLDFLLLSLLFPWVLNSDMERRGWSDRQQIFTAVSLFPLIGPLVYLTVRPTLIEAAPTVQENAKA